ncbi:DNA-3-methyladenine glycosylase family protein [Streptomyces xanthii]|uniref:DNA-3-methyladenine glycosylase 2 family protein n=1 Tax=Streptomyces xanthii TaxID=2768069 RepID=A0A7H1BAV2_9ACTN|nr:DNA-3-methyladenine glycosylase 2 family protein [Streptomyces xanthii]QNS05857.1 DNA-3-methyladenine glycosylase 2 family protein [Streptomyces xanthii]
MAGRRYVPNPAPRQTRTTVRGGATHVPRPAHAPVASTAEARVYAPADPVHLGLTLGPLRRGPADPTFRTTPDGSVWRTSRTPEGPATLRVTQRADGTVEATAWGPGAQWFLDQLPSLLGASDDPSAFEPRHRLVAQTARRRQGLRLTRTGLVLESLIPSILEQKITTDEAYRAWRLLLHKYGDPAPGPAGGDLRMRVVPDPYTWTRIPSWEWHKAGVDNKRASTILRAAKVARRLEEAAHMDPPAARARLELVPGIGPWTSAETIQRTNGAPDEVTTGDLHLPGIVGHALAGDRDATDADMLDLLAPYEGQRHRAARLILLSGATPPRRQPKMRRVNIAEW